MLYKDWHILRPQFLRKPFLRLLEFCATPQFRPLSRAAGKTLGLGLCLRIAWRSALLSSLPPQPTSAILKSSSVGVFDLSVLSQNMAESLSRSLKDGHELQAVKHCSQYYRGVDFI